MGSKLSYFHVTRPTSHRRKQSVKEVFYFISFPVSYLSVPVQSKTFRVYLFIYFIKTYLYWVAN